eukprot:gb/GECG01003895.1/.p1 GENE.gb/GECG01003895.1/~~gb/GECG01003895.1/.p1  ORF type:complete len:360 (+),score=16.52 gb/GECG01003895.1/:1-1080(+)
MWKFMTNAAGVDETADAQDAGADADGIARCSPQGSMPLYVIVIGYAIKTIIVIAIEILIEQLRDRVSNHATGGTRHTPEQRPRVDVPNYGADYTTMVDDENYANGGSKVVDIRSGTIPATTCSHLRRCPSCLRGYCVGKCVRVSWTLFLATSPLVQLVIDSIQVQSSGTKPGWHRYQCFVEVFANSPNVGTLVILWSTQIVKALASDEQPFVLISDDKTSTNIMRASFIAWAGMFACPFVTHVLPFLVAYCWVTLIVIGLGFGCSLVLVTPIDKRFDNSDVRGAIACSQVVARIFGLVVVLLFALGASSMIRFYGGDSSYINCLWLAMSERKTKDFLYHEVQTAMEARTRWYTFLHFFI